jgi:hypothetical protein
MKTPVNSISRLRPRTQNDQGISTAQSHFRRTDLATLAKRDLSTFWTAANHVSSFACIAPDFDGTSVHLRLSPIAAILLESKRIAFAQRRSLLTAHGPRLDKMSHWLERSPNQTQFEDPRIPKQLTNPLDRQFSE